MKNKFDLQILDHYWINGSHNIDDEYGDVTSHGKIRLLINNINISGCDDIDTDYGLNQAAPRLLRTVIIDHNPDNESWRITPLIPHGCSIFVTCPNCVIDFAVHHMVNNEVILDKFIVTGGPRDANPYRYFELSIKLQWIDYANKILAFAENVFIFLPVRKGIDYEIEEYCLLRNNHEKLMEIVKKSIYEGGVSKNSIKLVNELFTS
jgi:hypothetical protein